MEQVMNNLITSTGLLNLKNELKNLAKNPQFDKIVIASAFFIDFKFFDEINSIFKGNIELYVSMRFPTSPDALKQVLTLSKVQCFYLNESFHSKIILFFKGDQLKKAIVGSSNFTTSGLDRNIETK